MVKKMRFSHSKLRKRYYSFMEAFKYFTAFFQLEGKKLHYLGSVIIYWIFRDKTFPKTVLRLQKMRFMTRENGMDIAHLSSFYERETTDLITKLKPNFFLDIGAHIGRYSILMASKFSHVLAIEPSKSNFELLLKNIKLNNLEKKIKVLNIGSSDRRGTKTLFFVPSNEGLSSFKEKDSLKRILLKEKCKVDKLDNIIKQLRVKPQDIDIIKIDVEGAEIEVLRGARNILTKGKSVLIIEILMQKEAETIINFLNKFDYKYKKILDSRNFVFYKK